MPLAECEQNNLQALAKKLRNADGIGNFCNWMMYSSERNVAKSPLTQQGCFFSLRDHSIWSGRKTTYDIFAAWSAYGSNNLPKKYAVKQYWQWLFNDSVFSDIFLIKDPEFCWKNAWVVDGSIHTAHHTFFWC